MKTKIIFPYYRGTTVSTDYQDCLTGTHIKDLNRNLKKHASMYLKILSTICTIATSYMSHYMQLFPLIMCVHAPNTWLLKCRVVFTFRNDSNITKKPGATLPTIPSYDTGLLSQAFNETKSGNDIFSSSQLESALPWSQFVRDTKTLPGTREIF